MERRTITKLFLLPLFIVLNGCTPFVEYEDVSANKEFSSIINRTFITQKSLFIYGVNMSDPIGKEVHQYSVTPPPGMGGREIRSRDVLQIGTRFTLTKVRRCTTCYLDLGVRHSYVINILSSEIYDDHNIYMGGEFGDVQLVFELNTQYAFNPEFFRSIDT